MQSKFRFGEDRQKAVILKLVDKIKLAVHKEDAEAIYNGAELAIADTVLGPVKEAVIAEIEEYAGDNRSDDLQTVVDTAEGAVRNALSADAVEEAKQNAFDAVDAQLDAEMPAEPAVCIFSFNPPWLFTVRGFSAAVFWRLDGFFCVTVFVRLFPFSFFVDYLR